LQVFTRILSQPQDIVAQRLDAIEQELQLLRGDINQVLSLLTLLVDDKLS